MSRLRTLRGRIIPTGGKAFRELILDDGRINYGYRITSFRMWPDQMYTEDHAFNAYLSYARMPADATFDASDNRQIAWSWYIQSGFQPAPNGLPLGSTGFDNHIIDPDHLVNRDLVLNMFNSTDRAMNYLIELEERVLSDDEAIITIIKESSQSVSISD